MRILTIVDLPWDTRLGAARIFMELSRAWAAAGHDVSHYCLGDAFPAATSSPPASAWRRLRFPAKAAAFVRNNATRFDVIDCIVGALPVAKERLNFAGLLVARSIGSHRLYRDFEKMARERWPDQPRGKLSGRIFYTIFQRQLFRNSEKTLQYCDLIRRVHAIIPEAQFRFLGTLTDNERVLRDLNIPACDWIEIVPEFQPDELPKLLADSTAGVLLTYAEGFGLAVLEQLAAGIPTVSYDAPGPRSILQSSLPDLLVPVGNVEQCSAALIQILSTDLASYRKLIERCSKVASRFLWSRVAKETARLYEMHLARVRGGNSEFSAHG